MTDLGLEVDIMALKCKYKIAGDPSQSLPIHCEKDTCVGKISYHT